MATMNVQSLTFMSGCSVAVIERVEAFFITKLLSEKELMPEMQAKSNATEKYWRTIGEAFISTIIIRSKGDVAVWYFLL